MNHSFIISDKVLGEGSYGKVYVAKTNLNDKIAVKCCKVDEYGINNLVEVSLMKSITHPSLNSAIEVLSTSSTLYILQPLAVIDLHHYTSVFKNKHVCPVDELKLIYHSLLQATYILHVNNLIHCDIKASNVLRYSDGSVKLTDFTLSSIKLPDYLYNHTVCTQSHRPPECYLKLGWDEKLDLWALGCTFYEIAYGELLFKNPGINPKFSKKTASLILKHKMINSMIDWALITNQQTDLTLFDISYLKITFTDRYELEEMKEINELINNLLRINGDERWSADKMLKHSFFVGLTPVNPTYHVAETTHLSYSQQARIVRYIQQVTDCHHTQNLALKIYSKLEVNEENEYIKAVGAAFVANKLIIGSQPLLSSISSLPKEELVLVEQDIGHELGFRLLF